ncbi:MAG: YqgE/AlgH family protein [Alphaproteobacteria bacterium]|nr:YqgE/AlgH family protein [Alphaproteobacteria bacterium]
MTSAEDKKSEKLTGAGWLTGQFLIAMPNMPDPRFARSVIYICSHGPSGSMGLIVNRLYGELNFRALLGQLNINMSATANDLPVYFGGPVEPGRGFVLHSSDYMREGTVPIDDQISLTATVEILQALADGGGPTRALLALGYAGWGAGQLDAEIQANGWLIAKADANIVFSKDVESKWDSSLAKIGISPTMLSGDVGHA